MQNAQPCSPRSVSGLFLSGVFGQTFVYYAEFCLLPGIVWMAVNKK